MANIGVIGSGSWGLALASTLFWNGHSVCVWSFLEEEMRELKETHESKSKLPGAVIPDMLFTTDLKETVQDKDLLVMAVPSTATRQTAQRMKDIVEDGTRLIVVSKGIEEATLYTQTDIIEEILPQVKVGVLSGPSHAEEVIRKLPTLVVAGSKDKELAHFVQEVFMNSYFRVYTSPDMMGIELGASLKNVIALAAGMAEGLGYGDNAQAALITRGIREIMAIALKMGGKAETLGGLTGVGDLIVTCSSRHSRNRRAGVLIGQGMEMKAAMDEVKMVVEGVYSAKAALALGEKYHISLPIIEEVNHVLFDKKDPKKAVSDLMERDRKAEIDILEWNES